MTNILREHAMWFINNKIIDGLELRNWMGTVHETVVAKHAARMGLVSFFLYKICHDQWLI